MKRILFVDDEPNVLDGLQRMLRPMRKEWGMAFALGGEQALAALAEKPFDIVVTDMRMPGMDGATLLKRVMQEYPRVVRIVLSGHSSEEASLRSVGVAHQFLAKPCDAEKLKLTINHAFALRNLLTDETLTRTLSQLKSVPSIPTLYTDIMEELEYPDASVARIGKIVAEDPGMTAKILQLVNSAFFGLPRHVATPAEAASLLGTETIKVLVLSVDVFSQFAVPSVKRLAPEAVQKHCAHTAAIAKQIAIAEKATKEVADASFMAGFLHDVGKLILAQNMPDQYGQVMENTQKRGISLCEAERAVLGATHAEVGAYLLGLWGLPDSMVEATAFHHFPSNSLGDSFVPLTAVHVANVLAHELYSEDNSAATGSLDLDYLSRLGIEGRLPEWRKACEELFPVGAEA
jgi:HD-like signal output (HDOD) protein